MHSYWQDLTWDCCMLFFAHCTRVMALDLLQNLVYTQYHENKLTEFHQILDMHSYWQDLHVIFCTFVTEVWPLIFAKILFPARHLEKIDRMSPNLIYAFILTRYSLGLLHIIFRTFLPELWPLIKAKISFPLNIFRTNWQNFTKYYICIHIDKI